MCYHGWAYDETGQCVDMPSEPKESRFKEKVKLKAYPVREVGGLIFAYLGRGEPPVLPVLAVLARTDGVRAVEHFALWPAHLAADYRKLCKSVSHRHTARYWDRTKRFMESSSNYQFSSRSFRNPDATNTGKSRSTWLSAVGQARMLINHPWPGGKINHPRFTAIFRTPVDDTHTLLFHVTFTPEVNGKLPICPTE